MAYVIKYTFNQIFELLKNRDTRLDHLPLTSPITPILVLASYVYFVKKCGPSFMSKRKPYSLHNVIIIYDLIQIVLNASLTLWAVYCWYSLKPNYSLACEPLDWGTSDLAIIEAESVYYFYCLKLLDLCDTVFFVLRKRNRQVSFLHVYHHVAVVLGAYQVLGWSAGGSFLMVGIFNSLVHTFMYMYYFISAYKPDVKKKIQIKKSITKFQIVQFLFLIYCTGRPLMDPACPVSKFLLFETCFQNVFLLFLFSNFYYKNYFNQ